MMTHARTAVAAAAAVVLLALGGCPPPNAIHSLTLRASPPVGGTIIADPPQAAYVAGTRVTLEAVPNPGFVFANWEGLGINTTQPIVEVQVYQDRIYTAFFDFVGAEGEGEGEYEPGQVVQDGGFELGPNTPFWEQTSDQFAYIVCDAARCGTLYGLGAHTGEHWAYFSSVPGGGRETASISQEVIMPRTGAATLRFHVAAPAAETPFTFRVFLGQRLLFELDETGAGDYAEYREVAIDVSGQATGNTLPLLFAYTNEPGANTLTAVYVDDVSIVGEALPADGAETGATR